jgi:mannose-6-phosphate isomerase-like protein (cupin superfamily)
MTDPGSPPDPTVVALADLRIGPTTALFEGARHGGVGVSTFVVRTPPGRFVELHTHPYAETFLLLEGRARWTVGERRVELGAEAMLVVPRLTPHGFRNVGDVALLLVTVHESGTVEQTFLGVDPQ